MQNFFRPMAFAGFLAALIAAMYPEVLLGTKSFVLRDYGIFGYPLAAYHKHSFWSGEIPLWNPYNCAGLPFLAQWNTLALYPGSIIYLLFPLPWSLGFFMLAHQFLAGMGMYALARRICGNDWAAAVAGVLFAFSGLTMNSLMWPNNIAALGWMPWVTLALLRCAEVPVEGDSRRHTIRAVALAGLAGGCQMLTGAPELIAFTWLGALVALIANSSARASRIALVYGGAAVLTALIAAAQLLPFLQLLLNSQRDFAFGGSEWAMPLWGWANFFVPLFHNYRSPQGVFFQTDQEWTSSYYFGVTALCLVPFWWRGARRIWLWPIVILFAWWLAMGPAAYALASLKSVLPLLGFIRFPIKYVAIVLFAVPLVTAMALARITGEPDAKKAATTMAIAAAITGVVIVGTMGWSWKYPIPYEEPRAVVANGVLRIVLLALFGGVLWRLLKTGTSSVALKIALLIIVAADLVTHAPRQNTTADAAVYAEGFSRGENVKNLTHGSGRAFQTRSAHDRFYSEMRPNPTVDYTGRRLGLYGNCNLIDRIPTLDGFYSLYLPRQREIWLTLFSAPQISPTNGLADFLAIRAMSDPANPVEWDSREGRELPLITAGQAAVSIDGTPALHRVNGPEFDPTQTVVLAGHLAETEKAASPDTTINDVMFKPHHMEATVTASAPAWVVVSQAWYPAWRAFINGQPTEIRRANHAFQAIHIPAGQHRVTFKYMDVWFRFGAVLSTLGLALAGLLLIRLKPRVGSPSSAPGHKPGMSD